MVIVFYYFFVILAIWACIDKWKRDAKKRSRRASVTLCQRRGRRLWGKHDESSF